MIEYPLHKKIGVPVQNCISEMLETANAHGQPVRCDFNDIEIIVQPGSSADELIHQWFAESNRRHAAWLVSPERAEQERQLAERERKAKADRTAALTVSPACMALSDPEGWAECQRVNSDGYGAACCRYAEMWARIIEGMIATGQSVSSCAEHASHLADEEGITGFMYGCAVSILAKVWAHGEELRQWHNLKTQFGTALISVD
jgi:hypothetical protein